MGEFTIVGLRVVREAATSGSFSTAAEKLGYTQSAVSRQIALMEQAAGTSLFLRYARGVQLTAAGRVVLRHAESVLGQLDAARHDLRDLAVSRPPVLLRVGGYATAMAALVPRAIATLDRQQPQLWVRLREGTSPRLLAALLGGRLDLVVLTDPIDLPAAPSKPDDAEPGTARRRMITEPLMVDPLLVAFASDHPFADRVSVTPAQLRDQRWIVGSTEPGSTLLGAFTDGTWQPEVATTARDWFAKLGLVAAGLGITVVPGIAVPVLPPTIALVRIDHPAAIRHTVIAYPDTLRNDPSRQAFTEALRDSAAELSTRVRQRLR